MRRFVLLSLSLGILFCAASERGSATLTASQLEKLNEYARATIRYFTSPESNNLVVGFTHAFFGTGKFRVCDQFKQCHEEAWNLTRGYGSHVNVNEVTLRFVSLATAYKMGWLDYLPPEERYAASWGQIIVGLETLRFLQASGNPLQYRDGHFHRTYRTTINRDVLYDVDRTREEISCPDEDLQSSDDNALPFMNLLVLEGLASDESVAIPQRSQVVALCRAIRADIDLRGFVVGNQIAHYIEKGCPSGARWDRLSTEGAIILAALLVSGDISEAEFESIYASLSCSAIDWTSCSGGAIPIARPSFHSAMFMHGLRAIHGMPVTASEFPGLDYFETSTRPVFTAQMDYTRCKKLHALGTQVMTQTLNGDPVFERHDRQVQFPGNESRIWPVPGDTLSLVTGPHAWFIALQRSSSLAPVDIEQLFTWMGEYESQFLHSGSDLELGWEAAIPWTADDHAYAWQASDGTWRYTDWGRPFEALNAAYTVLSIFDALNPEAPLASFSVEAQKLKRIAFYLDNGRWPEGPPAPPVFRIERESGDVRAGGTYYGIAIQTGLADIGESVPISESVEPGDVLQLDPGRPGSYRKVREGCSPLVAGVVSSKPGLVLGGMEPADSRALLALSGIVPVKVVDEGGSIQSGDLLISSSTSGYAMRWAGKEPCPCALVGKALEPMTDESGMILVLLTAH